MKWILGAGYAVLGLILVYQAAAFSIRYNAWTTSLRERHPNINPPPTPEWRARNTRIMTAMFRIFGVFLLFFAVLYLLPLLVGNTPH
jgi:hypothetical protein